MLWALLPQSYRRDTCKVEAGELSGATVANGLTSVVKAVNGFDPKDLDGRTTLANELLQERNSPLRALGGPEGGVALRSWRSLT